MSNIKTYTQFISEQARRGDTAGFRSLTEQVLSESKAHTNWFKDNFGKYTTGSIDSGGRAG